MNSLHPLAAALVLAAGVAACTNEPPEIPVPKAGGVTSSLASQSSVPPAASDRDSPPAATPSTHTGEPQPEAPSAPTARDTAAHQPMADLTKEKESSSLPLPAQVNNHSTTAIDRPNKTTPQDGPSTDKQ